MKKLFKKLGFRKMDEMETAIALKAQRIAIIYVFIVLFLWTLYESYKVYAYHTKLNLFPGFLLITTSLIQNLSQFVLMKKATKGDEEKNSNKVYLFMLIIALLLVFINGIITFGVMR